MLAEDVAVADPQPRRFAAVGQVLRLVAEHGAEVDDVVGAELRGPHEDGVGQHAGARPDPDRTVDHDERADVRARVDGGARVDQGRRMDRHGQCLLYGAGSAASSSGTPGSAVGTGSPGIR